MYYLILINIQSNDINIKITSRNVWCKVVCKSIFIEDIIKLGDFRVTEEIIDRCSLELLLGECGLSSGTTTRKHKVYCQ